MKLTRTLVYEGSPEWIAQTLAMGYVGKEHPRVELGRGNSITETEHRIEKDSLEPVELPKPEKCHWIRVWFRDTLNSHSTYQDFFTAMPAQRWLHRAMEEGGFRLISDAGCGATLADHHGSVWIAATAILRIDTLPSRPKSPNEKINDILDATAAAVNSTLDK